MSGEAGAATCGPHRLTHAAAGCTQLPLKDVLRDAYEPAFMIDVSKPIIWSFARPPQAQHAQQPYVVHVCPLIRNPHRPTVCDKLVTRGWTSNQRVSAAQRPTGLPHHAQHANIEGLPFFDGLDSRSPGARQP